MDSVGRLVRQNFSKFLNSERSERGSVSTYRSIFVAALIGLAVTLFITTKGFRGVELGLGWIVLGAAFSLGGGNLKHKLIFAGLIILLVSLYIAVPGSIWWGRGNWEVTLYHTVWMTPFLLLYLIDKGEEVFLWLIPLLVLHSGVLVYQEVVGKPGRQMGLLDNPNPAGALLAIDAVYMLNNHPAHRVASSAAEAEHLGSRSAFA